VRRIASARVTELTVTALCAISASSENNYIVYPLPAKTMPAQFQPPSHAPPKGEHVVPTSGGVLIYDATKLEAANVIDAHNSPLSCIALNSDGTLLATASEKGTIIRVFSVPGGEKLYQFRRGSIPAKIYCMSFNSTSTLLCVSSATETVHVFRLNGPNTSRNNSITGSIETPSSRGRSNSRSSQEVQEPSEYDYEDSTGDVTVPERKSINPTFASMFRRTSQNVGKSFAATVGGYLPKGVAEMWEPARDFAWVKIPKAQNLSSTGPMRTVVAPSNNGPQVMVVTSEGNYYVYNVDLEKGGEGVLVKTYSSVHIQVTKIPVANQLTFDRLLEPNELAPGSSKDFQD
jgi:autophagy-related protein 18